MAQAIAKYIKGYVNVLPGDGIFDLPTLVNDLPRLKKFSCQRIIICEDIDCGLKNRYIDFSDSSSFQIGRGTNDGDGDDDEAAIEDTSYTSLRDRVAMSHANKTRSLRRKGFSSLLNAMDGLAAPEHVVYIFTTNDMDVIDPALLRPGRLDLKLEITFVNRKQFDEFTLRHYGKVSDQDFSIKDGMTFAAIQNEVMKDASFEEIIDFVKK